MISANRFSLTVLVVLLILSNVFWAYAYFTSIQQRDNALREGTTALAIILAHASTLLKEAGDKGQNEYLEVAYMLVDQAIPVAQTLDKLTGGSSWTHKIISAIASLHDLLANTHQGYTINKDKLTKIGDTLRNLAKALKNLNIENIEHYSERLEAIAYSQSQ